MDFVKYSVILMTFYGTFAEEICTGDVKIVDGKLIINTKNICDCLKRNGILSTKSEDSVSSDTLNLSGGGEHLEFKDPANFCKYGEKPPVTAGPLSADIRMSAGNITLMILAVVVVGALAASGGVVAFKKYQTTAYAVPPEQNDVTVEMGQRNNVLRCSNSTTGTTRSLLGR